VSGTAPRAAAHPATSGGRRLSDAADVPESLDVPDLPDPRSLHALTVELPPGGAADTDALVARSEMCIVDERLALGGWGTAAVLALPAGLTDQGALDRVQAWLAALPHRTSAGPGDGSRGGKEPAVVALGALPFDRSAPGHLVVPGLLVRTLGDGRRWATAVAAGNDWPDPAEVRARAIAMLGPDLPLADAPVPDPPELTEIPAGAGYRAAVTEALARTGRGELAKVVLARTVTARFDAPVTAAAALRRLRAAEPSCTVFAFPLADPGDGHVGGAVPGCFLGASPELLVRRQGATVESHPLAGTVGLDDGNGQGRDGADEAIGHLLASAKDRVEHRLVVEAVASALGVRCTELSVPDAPSLVRLRSVAHLGTAVRGTLRPEEDGGEPSVLALLAALHPTPAVGGVPLEGALASIAELEASPRGLWAGPVGWVDATGDGQWVIGIRSATVRGAFASLTAGAGIVAGSDPLAELEETTVKLAPVLEALAPGAGRLL
jgi:isochorismate synthase